MPQLQKTDIIYIEKDLRIDKNDIVNIAIAEAETKIKKTIQNIQAQRDKTETSIKETIKNYNQTGLAAIEKYGKRMALKYNKFIGAGETKVKLPGSFTTKVETSLIAHDKLDPNNENRNNTYRIYLTFNNEKESIHTQMLVYSRNIKVLPQQKSIANKIRTLQDHANTLANEALSWRRKLSDLPSMERQFKAVVAKREIEKTQQGRDIITNLMKNIDNDIKLLGL